MTFTMPPALGTPIVMSAYDRNGMIPAAITLSEGGNMRAAFDQIRGSAYAANPFQEAFKTIAMYKGYNAVKGDSISIMGFRFPA